MSKATGALWPEHKPSAQPTTPADPYAVVKAEVARGVLSVSGEIVPRMTGLDTRSTWLRAWVGRVELVVSSTACGELETWMLSPDGERHTIGLILARMHADGMLLHRATLLEVWGNEPRARIGDGVVIWSRDVEIEDDGPPWPGEVG